MAEPGQPQLQPNLSFEQLHTQAQESKPILQSRGKEILENLKQQDPELFEGVRFEVAETKDIDRAKPKIIHELDGDHRLIKDLTRGRFVADTPEQIRAIQKALEAETDVANVKDRFSKPVGSTSYRDINAEITLENGHISEIQIRHSATLEFDDLTHELRTRAQEIRRQAKAENRSLTPDEKTEIKQGEKLQRDLNRAVAHDSGLNEMLDPDVRKQHLHTGPLDAKGSALGALAEKIGDFGKRGNTALGVIAGVTAGGIALAGGASPAEAGELAAETAVPYGETINEARQGNYGLAAEAAVVETTSNIGAAGGMVLGAQGGAYVGAAGGPLVAGAGAVIGGGVGLVGGAVLGSEIGQQGIKVSKEAAAKVHQGAVMVKEIAGDALRDGAEWAGDAYDSTVDAASRSIDRAVEMKDRAGQWMDETWDGWFGEEDMTDRPDSSAEPAPAGIEDELSGTDQHSALHSGAIMAMSYEELAAALPPQDTENIAPETQAMSVYADTLKRGGLSPEQSLIVTERFGAVRDQVINGLDRENYGNPVVADMQRYSEQRQAELLAQQELERQRDMEQRLRSAENDRTYDNAPRRVAAAAPDITNGMTNGPRMG